MAAMQQKAPVDSSAIETMVRNRAAIQPVDRQGMLHRSLEMNQVQLWIPLRNGEVARTRCQDREVRRSLPRPCKYPIERNAARWRKKVRMGAV